MVGTDNADLESTAGHGTIQVLWQMLDHHELPLRLLGAALGVVLLLILMTVNLEVRLPGVRMVMAMLGVRGHVPPSSAGSSQCSKMSATTVSRA